MSNPGGLPSLTQESVDTIVRRYTVDKVGATTIAKELGINKRTVYNHLARLGIGTRSVHDRTGDSYSIAPGILAGVTSTGRPRGGAPGPKTFFRENAFEVLTDDVAYWLGFLMADGCVHSPKDRPTKRLFLRVSTKDLDHLERFKAFLGTSNAIHIKKHLDPAGVEQETACLAVTSDPLCASLARWGVLERKPNRGFIHADLRDNRHFWRGMIDGDGNISKSSGAVYLSGGLAIVAEWASYVVRLRGGEPPLVRPQPGCFVGTVSGQRARCVLQHLYQPGDVYLARKADLAK